MFVAFSIGCIGSLLGSFFGFQVSAHFANIVPPTETKIWPIAASCLAASYIGGTVNFYETAQALGATGQVAKTLHLIAAADIIVMVLYFGILTSLREWILTHKMEFLQPRIHDSRLANLKDEKNEMKKKNHDDDAVMTWKDLRFLLRSQS